MQIFLLCTFSCYCYVSLLNNLSRNINIIFTPERITFLPIRKIVLKMFMYFSLIYFNDQPKLLLIGELLPFFAFTL